MPESHHRKNTGGIRPQDIDTIHRAQMEARLNAVAIVLGGFAVFLTVVWIITG